VEFQIIAGELCLDFINTLDNRPVPERRTELLPTYHDLVDWAVQARAISPLQRSALLREAGTYPKAAEQTLSKAISLRECLYRIISSTPAESPPGARRPCFLQRLSGRSSFEPAV